ncbi:MAG: class I SAM-dependent methyltransferase [Candidatus Omnitrophica bacterium]|nr:class I SAM-dependent methyltransferase [Candidatus Omnitrophota bacterium]
MNWRQKGILQNILSVVPFGTALNDLLQIKWGGLRDIDSAVEEKFFNDWLVFCSLMKEIDLPIQELVFFEVGTGWFPVLPFCFSLAGAKKCLTYDINRHMNAQLTFKMVSIISRFSKEISNVSLRQSLMIESYCQQYLGSADLHKLLEQARIEYHAPADATKTGLASESVDVLFSNSVLEHVPSQVIFKLMEESYRVLRKKGIIMHSVNCGDHYAYFDKNITPINYLRYSESDWKFWNNALQFQNRLRPIDFVESAKKAGFEILLYKYKPKPDLLNIVSSLKIAREFHNYSIDQICSTSVDFVAIKK